MAAHDASSDPAATHVFIVTLEHFGVSPEHVLSSTHSTHFDPDQTERLLSMAAHVALSDPSATQELDSFDHFGNLLSIAAHVVSFEPAATHDSVTIDQAGVL